MHGLVDEHRDVHGVEPICAVLQIAPLACRRYADRRSAQAFLSAKAQRDVALLPVMEQVWHANLQVYGADNVSKQTNRGDDGHYKAELIHRQRGKPNLD